MCRAQISVTGRDGKAVSYLYREGKVGDPEAMDTTYLDCKTGMKSSAIDLESMAGLVDEALQSLDRAVSQYGGDSAVLDAGRGRANARPGASCDDLLRCVDGGRVDIANLTPEQSVAHCAANPADFAFAKRSNATEVVVLGFAGLGVLFLLQGVFNSLF